MQSAQFQLHARIEEHHWWFAARRRIMQSLVRQTLPPGGERSHTVLDVGCGTGANLAALADEYQTIGIDASAEAIMLARRNHPGIEFFHGFAPDDIPEVMPRVDLVLLMDVLEHVPDDLLLFSRLLAACRPGTKFLVTVPADYALWSQHDESFGHYRRYDAARFARIWQGLPVRQQLCSYYNTRLYPAVRLIRGINRWRGGVAGDAGTDFRLPPAPLNRLCEGMFAGEAAVLGRTMADGGRGYTRGVSLIAVLERTEGEVFTRGKSAGLSADYYDPTTGRYAAR